MLRSIKKEAPLLLHCFDGFLSLKAGTRQDNCSTMEEGCNDPHHIAETVEEWHLKADTVRLYKQWQHELQFHLF
jgi:hypothetical protein